MRIGRNLKGRRVKLKSCTADRSELGVNEIEGVAGL